MITNLRFNLSELITRWEVEGAILISFDLVVMICSVAALMLYLRISKDQRRGFPRHFAKILSFVALDIIFRVVVLLITMTDTIKSVTIP